MSKNNFEQYIKEEIQKKPELAIKLQKAELALDIADQIINLRQQKGLTQHDLAKLIGVNQSNIARLENAEYAGYSLKTLQKISRALGASLNIIMASPEQTSLIYSCLYNTQPTVISVRSSSESFDYTLWGSMSFCKKEIFNDNLFDPGDFKLTIKPKYSKDNYQNLTL